MKFSLLRLKDHYLYSLFVGSTYSLEFVELDLFILWRISFVLCKSFHVYFILIPSSRS